MEQERAVQTETPMLTPALIWREMPHEQRLAAALAFWADNDSVPQQMEAIQAIARQLHFRPQSVLRLPQEKLARHLASQSRASESLAGRLLVVYHLSRQRPMLEAFLNQLGIAHEQGLISDAGPHAPDPAALGAAAEALKTQFPVEDVRLYFRTLAAQDPETWGALAEIVSRWPVSASPA
jgi:hypothetical protein